MTYLPIGHHDFSNPDDNNECKILVTNADQRDVNLVLSGNPTQEETRSQWVWLRFPDGALVLAVFPQGDQYFNVEPGVERSIKELEDKENNGIISEYS